LAPVVLRALYVGAFFGGSNLIPLMMTLQHGYGASVAALPLAMSDALWAVGAWVQSRPARGDDQEYRIRLVRVGFGLTMVGLAVSAAVAYSSTPAWLMFPGWCVAGLGAGMTFATINVLVLRHTTDANRGFDAAANQLSGAVGQAMTTGVAGMVIAAAAAHTIGFDTAFAATYVGMAILLAVGWAAAARLRAPVPVDEVVPAA
jgi:MFS family permease